jgi:hypothetical protein
MVQNYRRHQYSIDAAEHNDSAIRTNHHDRQRRACPFTSQDTAKLHTAAVEGEENDG